MRSPSTGPSRRFVTLVLLAVAMLASGCTLGGRRSPSPSAGSSVRAGRAGVVLQFSLASFQLPAPIEREVAVFSAGTIYLAGGLDSSARSVAGVFALNPHTGRLRLLGSLPRPVHDAAGAMLGGRLVVFGGGVGESSDAVQAFDPASGRGRLIGRLPKALSDLGAAIVGSTVYLVGGYDGTSPQSAIYATTDGIHYRVAGTLPVGLRYPAVAAWGDEIVIGGGQSGAGPVNEVEVFDTRSGRVTVIGRLPTRLSHAAALVLGGGVYLVGGRDARGAAAQEAVAVDPGARTVRPATPLLAGLADPGAVSDGTTAWLLGGWRGGALTQILRARLVAQPAAAPQASQAAGSSLTRPFGGLLLIADRGNDRLLVVDAHKHILWRYPSRSLPAPPFPFFFPDDAFWVHGGRAILVNEEENHILAEIAYPSGKTLWTYGHPGKPGSARGYLNQPDDVYPYPGGGLVVADAKNCRILFFDAAGHPTRQIGVTASPDVAGACFHHPPRHLGYPNGDTPLRNGDLLLSELRGGWVSEITPQGRVVWAVRPRGVSLPSDPQLLSDGSILVVDYNTPGRIVRFRPDGTLLWDFGPTSGPGELHNSSLAAMLPNGLIGFNDDFGARIVLLDPGSGKIVWQYGITGKPGRANGLLSYPDGFDLLLPGGIIPQHLDFSTPTPEAGRP